MRVARVALFAVVMAAVSVMAMPLAASDAAESLAQTEQRGLNALGAQGLRKLIREPRRRTTEEAQFSRAWIDAQPGARGGDQWLCLSEALYFEARGETVKGQFAVAEVIMNRVKSGRFPDTLCGVIHQGTGQRYQCQFTYTCDGRAEVISEKEAFERVSKVARMTIDGRVPELTNGATHYHTTAVRPGWARVYTRTARIGDHLFYRHTWRSASN
jgi:spore germination cell wall hydrolase CwlJ-like protein